MKVFIIKKKTSILNHIKYEHGQRTDRVWKKNFSITLDTHI